MVESTLRFDDVPGLLPLLWGVKGHICGQENGAGDGLGTRLKEHWVQWQLNRSCSLTCTPGHVAAQFSWHGNCTTVTVDTVILPSCLRF